MIITEPALIALANREEANRNGKMSTIIFIRDKNQRNQEISGYIDYAHRLKTEDFAGYFLQKKRLLPRIGDLSYFNWETQNITANPTPNYAVITDNPGGILFKNKRDRKILNVDPWLPSPGDNTTRNAVLTNEYLQFVLYDHITRRKT
ncbi:unnamed protein product [Dibothriocephalus latus]|uniref:Cilia- and flagella-associated protein 299 n=1 Tax=Dibothriocephalus latus TaxID=60516 RepID=A0A3P7LA89_DIBLA|nr:unnamed protein product [Dibothriocephalus latus]